ncbi:MAG: TetR/AcrR family transcriptional regulator [Proteobacteria bacterium]|nr:TetR/AcrR family transcriptional regulator [Pseudomonadota bacterium]
MPGNNKRAMILEAAVHTVEVSGAAHLTIDAVAVAAGVSKGGLLYHFPSKQALLEGMLEYFLEQMNSRTAAYQASHPDDANVALVARIIEEHDQKPAQRAMARAILAAAAEDPDLLAPTRQVVKLAFDEAAQGSTPPDMGWVLLLAVEGLRFLEVLKMLPLSRAERKHLHTTLLDLARSHAT